MSSIRTIAKNTTVLFSSQVISYILLFFVAIYSARYLGTENFGILSLALAITGIYFVFTDFGLNTLIVREVSRDKSLYNKLFTNSIIIKCFLGIITLFITYLTVMLVNYPFNVALVIYIVMISVIFNSFTGIINSIFQAYEKMEYQSVSNILNGIIMLSFVLFAIHNHLNLTFFAEIYLIASIVIFIFSVIVFCLKFNISKVDIKFRFWKLIMSEAWPFGLNSIFAVVFVWIDSFLLSIMIGNASVGIYNAAYQIIIVLLFIPIIFNTVVFPLMSKFYISSRNSLIITLRKYFKLIVIIAIPIGVAITILSNKIILMLFGSSFIGSIIALQILIWAAVLIFINSPFVQLIQATNHQKTLTKITAICMIINILLNLILIPKFSYLAASVVTVITEFAMAVFVIYAVYNIGYKISFIELKDAILVFLASMIMGLFITFFVSINLIITIILAIIIYLILLLLLKVIGKEELQLLQEVRGKF